MRERFTIKQIKKNTSNGQHLIYVDKAMIENLNLKVDDFVRLSKVE